MKINFLFLKSDFFELSNGNALPKYSKMAHFPSKWAFFEKKC